MTKIKICGLKRIEDVSFAIKQGADFVGLVLVPHHQNTVDEKDILPILDITKRAGRNSVGIFQNQDRYMVLEMVKKYSFDFVQLHGNESLQYCKEVRKIASVMKVFSIDNTKPVDAFISAIKAYESGFDYVVLDRQKQGVGEMVDVDLAREIALHFPTFIAGGLTPKNVLKVVKKVQPFGVDVSEGVKTRGLADYRKIKEFIRNLEEFKGVKKI